MKGKFNVVLLYIVIGKLLDEFFNSARKFFDVHVVSSIMLSLIKISTNFDGEEVFFSLWVLTINGMKFRSINQLDFDLWMKLFQGRKSSTQKESRRARMNERDSRMFDSLAFSRFLFLYRFPKKDTNEKKKKKRKGKKKQEKQRETEANFPCTYITWMNESSFPLPLHSSLIHYPSIVY